MSYVLSKTGAQIDAILNKAEAGGVIQKSAATFSDVNAAIALGSPVIIKDGSDLYQYSTSMGTTLFFTQMSTLYNFVPGPYLKYLTLTNTNVWSSGVMNLQSELTFDNTPTDGSTNPVTSDGIYEAIKAGVADSLITDTASGEIASFPDGADNVPVKSLTAQITPLQDLHGYDNPWPAGGSANLISFPYASSDGTYSDVTFSTDSEGKISASGTSSGNINFYLMQQFAPEDGDYTLSINKPSAPLNVALYDSTTGSTIASLREQADSLTVTLDSSHRYAVRVSRTGEGNVVSFTGLCVQLEKGSTATGWKPYKNICPISGWTGAGIPVNGNNLCNWKINTTSADPLEIYLKPNTYRIEASAAIASGNWYVRMSNSSGEYFANADMGLAEWSRASSGWAYGGAAATGMTFTVPSGCALVEIGKLNADGTIPAMLNIGSTALPYEEYLGTTYSIDWTDEAGTVYGGTLNVTTGELTVIPLALTMANKTSLTVGTSGAGVKYADIGTPVTLENNTYLLAISSAYKAIPQAQTAVSGEFKVYSNAITVFDNRFTDVATATSILTSENFIAVAKRLNPLVFQLTPTEVKTLLGDNNIFADCGSVDVTYRADTALYIDKKLGA